MAERITEIELAELEQIVENSGEWYSPVLANALYEYGPRLIAEVRALRDATSWALRISEEAHRYDCIWEAPEIGLLHDTIQEKLSAPRVTTGVEKQ